MSENSNSEESEEAISQHLEDLGMLEDGMTLDDKRSLWTVVKISQDTAKAEEQDRQKQARRALQFDQVSSRTESSSGSEESPDIVVRSPTCKGEDKTSEEEKKPTIAAVLPQLRTTPLASVAPSQRTTATVLPLFRFCEGDMSQDQTTVNSGSASVPSCSESNPVDVSQNQQVDSKFEDSHSPIRCVAQPSARRHMRPSPDVEMKEFKKLNPKNNLSRLNSSSSPLSRLSDKEQDELQTVPQTERVTEVLKSEAPHRNSVMTSSDVPKLTLSSRKSVEHREQGTTSSSTVPVKSSKHSDQDALVSPVSNSQESFLVRRMQHSLRMSNDRKNDVKEKINDISEINEDCCEENNFDALKEQTEDMEKMTPGCSSVDNVPSSSSYSPSNEAKSKENCSNSRDTKKKVSEDRERNINAFDCDRSNYGRTLKARKAKRTRLRLPFYIPPRKMDIHTYITYFKTSIKEQAVRLIEVQQRSHRCVPWGEPVVVGESDSTLPVNAEQEEQESKSVTNLQRYNFRNRKLACQRADTIYEDLEAQSDDEMFITNPSKRTVTAESQLDAADDLFDSLLEGHKKEDDKGPLCRDADNSNLNFTSVDRQGSMKRKSESSDDQTFDQEEKSNEPQEKRVASSSWLMVKKDESPPIAVKRKKLCQVMSYAEPAHNYEDLEGDFEPSEKFMRRRDGVKSYVKKKNLRKTSSKQSHSLNKDRDMDDDVNIFDDLDNAEGVGGDRGSREETETIRPGPIKLRKQGRRRLFHQSQVEKEKHAEAEEKEREDPPMADITVMYETKSSDDKEEESELLPCPICRNTFPAKDIEAHASECNEYCEEEIPPDELHISESSSSPEMGLQSTRGSISEQCWRDYENGKGFQGHHSSTYKRGQQRPQTRQDELEAPLSPIRCFVPISAQHDSEIDYLHQFRIATSIKQRARQTQAAKRGKKRKRKVQVKTAKGRKKARSGGKEKVSSCAKTFEDSW